MTNQAVFRFPCVIRWTDQLLLKPRSGRSQRANIPIIPIIRYSCQQFMSIPETQQPVGLSDIVLSRRTLAWHCGATRETLRAARWLGSNVMVRQYAMSQHIGEATSNSAASQASQERHNRRLRYKSKDYPRHYYQNPNRVPQTCPVIGLAAGLTIDPYVRHRAT